MGLANNLEVHKTHQIILIIKNLIFLKIIIILPTINSIQITMLKFIIHKIHTIAFKQIQKFYLKLIIHNKVDFMIHTTLLNDNYNS